jgi:hypothetical protein
MAKNEKGNGESGRTYIHPCHSTMEGEKKKAISTRHRRQYPVDDPLTSVRLLRNNLLSTAEWVVTCSFACGVNHDQLPRHHRAEKPTDGLHSILNSFSGQLLHPSLTHLMKGLGMLNEKETANMRLCNFCFSSETLNISELSEDFY